VARLVVLLGRSPGVLRDVICSLLARGVVLDKVYVVGTRDSLFDEAEKVLHACPCPQGNAKTIPLHKIILPYNDIDSFEKLTHFRTTIRALANPNTIVDVTGGRKLMSVGAAIEALQVGVQVSYLLVPPQELERLKNCKPDENPCTCTTQNPKHITF